MSLGGVSSAVLALVLYVVYLGLVVGVRILIQLRRTGSTGVHGLGGRLGSTEWIAGVGFVLAFLIGAAAPLFALLGVVEPIAVLDTDAIQICGLGLALTGIAMTFYAQMAMGASWRVGVDDGERTELVTSGPFALVRHPIFAAVFPTALGLALLVPSWIAFAGLAVLVIALELQVRVVEEPYLLKTHPSAYAAYAAHVGRFAPGIGRIR